MPKRKGTGAGGAAKKQRAPEREAEYKAAVEAANGMTVLELRGALYERKLDTEGKKAPLLASLLAAIEKEFAPATGLAAAAGDRTAFQARVAAEHTALNVDELAATSLKEPQGALVRLGLANEAVQPLAGLLDSRDARMASRLNAEKVFTIMDACDIKPVAAVRERQDAGLLSATDAAGICIESINNGIKGVDTAQAMAFAKAIKPVVAALALVLRTLPEKLPAARRRARAAHHRAQRARRRDGRAAALDARQRGRGRSAQPVRGRGHRPRRPRPERHPGG